MAVPPLLFHGISFVRYQMQPPQYGTHSLAETLGKKKNRSGLPWCSGCWPIPIWINTTASCWVWLADTETSVLLGMVNPTQGKAAPLHVLSVPSPICTAHRPHRRRERRRLSVLASTRRGDPRPYRLLWSVQRSLVVMCDRETATTSELSDPD